MEITEKDKERLQAKYDKAVGLIAKKNPSLIEQGEAIHILALNLTALSETIEQTTKIIVKNIIEGLLSDVVEYQKLGYPYGKTERGLKRWLKKQIGTYNVKPIFKGGDSSSKI